MNSKPTVYIHTNDKQLLGALVGAYSMKSNSRHADEFDIKIIRLEETPHLSRRQGAIYLRKGKQAVWLNEDLQSFSPLRMIVPQLMGYDGRAVVTDPDVFAVGDIYDLLTRDMGEKAILCRHISSGYKNNGHGFYASSVMLLDCSRLDHWRWNDEIDRMFKGELDYGPWIGLKNERPESIGEIGEAWNSFDKLTCDTKLLHTTERSTQPWRTGLPIDFDLTTGDGRQGVSKRIVEALGNLFRSGSDRSDKGRVRQLETYQSHPDPAQEKLFFDLLSEAINAGDVSIEFVKERMQNHEVRQDALELLRATGLKI